MVKEKLKCEYEKRLRELDNKTAIFQFSHGQKNKAYDTIYFKKN